LVFDRPDQFLVAPSYFDSRLIGISNTVSASSSSEKSAASMSPAAAPGPRENRIQPPAWASALGINRAARSVGRLRFARIWSIAAVTDKPEHRLLA